jgi:hypothetical protein
MKAYSFFKNFKTKQELGGRLKELEEKLEKDLVGISTITFYKQIKSKLETEKVKLEKAKDKSDFSRIENEIEYLEMQIRKTINNKKNERDMIEALQKYQLRKIKEIFKEIESYGVMVHSLSLKGQSLESLSNLYKELLQEILPQVKQNKIKEIRISRNENGLTLSYLSY